MAKTYAEVYVELKNRRLDKTFHYKIPESLKEQISVGVRVTVPFGSGTYQGYVVDLADRADVSTAKSIKNVLDTKPVFTVKDIELARWMAEQYMCPFVAALECMLPAGLKYESRTVVRLKENAEEVAALLNTLKFLNPDAAAVLQELMDRQTVALQALENKFPGKNIAEGLQQLKQYGIIEVRKEFYQTGIRYAQMAVVPESIREQAAEELQHLRRRAPKQAILLETILQAGGEIGVSNLLQRCGASRSSLNGLVDKGLVKLKKQVDHSNAGSTNFLGFPLTDEQRQVYRRLQEAIRITRYRPFLLHGVTGSGKTEIYLRAVASVLQKGRQALVLVPEIALTPQMTKQFTDRFGEQVAVLHSGFGRSKRLQEWLRIRNGEANVVLGARSAVFAPLADIGLIIIDEEHESSYKQDRVPKYHAREVAEFRAQQHQAVLLIASATPSLESYASARRGRYQLLTMKRRASNRPLPAVAVVDMREERRQGNSGIFSTALYQSLESCIDKGNQAILFLNRRGYSSFFICTKCGFTIRCPHCDIALTYHDTGKRLLCHYCGHRQQVTHRCPRCGAYAVGGVGCGTQQVEHEVKHLFPGVPVIRVDVDTTRRQGSHERLLEDFRSGKAQLLIGTQMVAKGLDFPNVTLVGVVSADTGLNLPDFRSWERTFQLLTQVAGRAGRGKLPGRVIVQTYNPDNPAIEKAKVHDYDGFFREEIKRRRHFGYPPFCHLLRILITGQEQQTVMDSSQVLADCIKEHLSSVAGELLGPAPAPVSKIKDRHRWHVVLKSPYLQELKKVVNRSLQAFAHRYNFSGIMISIDVNPTGMI
ncbi:MAG: primosomal protein N' [Thermoanaerobacteraceae bacterium]|nr:primosomal protein N' [Thermoanaerobacteraceae bacterium]